MQNKFTRKITTINCKIKYIEGIQNIINDSALQKR